MYSCDEHGDRVEVVACGGEVRDRVVLLDGWATSEGVRAVECRGLAVCRGVSVFGVVLGGFFVENSL
jgi:hypothetical protein